MLLNSNGLLSSSELEKDLDSIYNSCGNRSELDFHLAKLEDHLKSRRICDADLNENIVRKILSFLDFCFDAEVDAANKTRFRNIYQNIVFLPDFRLDAAEKIFSIENFKKLLSRFELGLEDERSFLRDVLHWSYMSFPKLRPNFREEIGEFLMRYSRTFNKRVHIREILEVVYQIIKGMRAPLSKANKDFYLHILLPLHRTNSMYEWRDQIPMLELFHESLVLSVLHIISMEETVLYDTIDEILMSWPKGFQSNTPKEVLLLHELEIVLKKTTGHQFSKILPKILPYLERCFSMDNSRVVERALFMWKDTSFVGHMKSQVDIIMKPITIALFRNGEPSWNPTVNKMSAFVLQQLEDMDPSLFAAICDEIWKNRTVKPKLSENENVDSAFNSEMKPKDYISTGSTFTKEQQKAAAATQWRPSKDSRIPPSTVTGIAPWALDGQYSKSSKIQQMIPPVDESRTAHTGLEKMHIYMKMLLPHEKNDNTSSSWVESQLEPTPTLLPMLRFHDLVFGHNLGTGTFSTVQYARKIDCSQPRSSWPEFAVKIISAENLKKFQYAKSARNEVAILRLLSHPGIARMISSFRWHGSVYLVLEYGSRGDLHHFIIEYGSLDENCTRFVLGQVLAAISAVHDIGFIYGDLKPENIVITHSGHVKLTDFGACRPATAEAKKILEDSVNVLRMLRDGDWRTAKGLTPDQNASAPIDIFEEEEEDLNLETRMEGTASYLAPEVAKNQFMPSFLSDAWAVGCLLYHCMVGRPPIFIDDESEAISIVVRFVESENSLSLPEEASESAKKLFYALLEKNVEARLTIHGAVHHSFFCQAQINPFDCYKMTPVEFKKGSFDPAPKSSPWIRRQNSMIWAPMVSPYNAACTTISHCAPLQPADYVAEGKNFSALKQVDESDFERSCKWISSPISSIFEGMYPPPSIGKINRHNDPC